jgi:dCMP deaminase
MKDPRPSWDSYFMGLARQAATRSTCLRRQVGAVLVQNRSHRGSGYNGAPAGIDSCLDLGECLMRDGHCIRAVHAELNLILQTDMREREGATVYVTDFPCWRCANFLANSGIAEIVYSRPYHRDVSEVQELMQRAGITLRRFDERDAESREIETKQPGLLESGS